MRTKTSTLGIKKILLFILFFVTNIGIVSATNSCETFLPTDVEFIGKITSGVNIRDYPCSYNSNKIGLASVGEFYSVTAKVDGWYQIELKNGVSGWVWDQMLEKTYTSEKKIYELSIKDKVLINKVMIKIGKIIDSKGVLYKERLVSMLEKTLNKTKNFTKTHEIVKSIVEETKKINLLNLANKHYANYNVDIDIIKNNWLQWHNIERNNIGVNPYTYNSLLDNTAYEWSVISENKGVMEHKRNYFDDNYDYPVIEKWFNERGVKCKVINGTTSSESVGKFGYYCKDSECTDEIIPALKDIYDVYLGEKGQSYDAHYRAIAHKNISQIGIGLQIYKTSEKNYYEFYVTTHYCTEFIEEFIE